MSQDREDLERVAAAILRATRAGRTRWVEAGGDSFVAQFRAGSVRMKSRDNDGAFPLVLDILDASGRVIASDGSELPYLPDGEPVVLSDEAEAWNAQLERLYSAARRSGLKLDETLPKLLREISEGQQPQPDAEDDIPF